MEIKQKYIVQYPKTSPGLSARDRFELILSEIDSNVIKMRGSNLSGDE